MPENKSEYLSLEFKRFEIIKKTKYMVKEDWKSKVQTGWSRKLLTLNPNQKQFEYQFHPSPFVLWYK